MFGEDWMVGCLVLTSQLTGSTEGTIRITYGAVKRDGQIPSSFYTRQIVFPVLFTVYHTLETHSLDLVRLVGSKSKTNLTDRHLSLRNGHLSNPTTPLRESFDLAAQDMLRQQLVERNGDAHCLLGLSVRNVYGVPFELTLTCAGSPGECRSDL